jgi:sec-independent protein translocase protein TatC
MTEDAKTTEGAMSLLDHLDELRSRLLRCVGAFVVGFFLCWAVSDRLLEFLLEPIRKHLFEGGEIVFIHLPEPFLIYMKASALAAIFLVSPYILYQVWAFVAPGLYRKEKRMVVPFLFFGTLFFVAGGAFGYYVAVPVAANWLIDLGTPFKASITLRSAFQFESWILLGMGAVFEMPIVIFFLSRIGVVTPRFLLRNFRIAVLVIAVLSAVLTPTGDVMTMSVFAGPMILLYLLGVAVSWIFGRKYARADLLDAFRDAGLERIAGWRRRLAAGSVETPGRGSLARLEILPGLPVVLKALRRGGALAPLWMNRFAGAHRVLDNLVIPLAAIERRVPTPAPLALLACSGPPGLWRGWLAVEEIGGGEDLLTRVRRGALPDPVWRSVMTAVRALHDAGVEHRDLNLGNLLHVDGGRDAVHILDLDGARLHDDPLPVRLRARGLMRLRRSFLKTVATASVPASPPDWAGLYAGGDEALASRLSPGPLDELRVMLHRAGWRR